MDRVDRVRGDVEDASPLNERGSHGTRDKSLSVRADSTCTQSLESLGCFRYAIRLKTIT